MIPNKSKYGNNELIQWWIWVLWNPEQIIIYHISKLRNVSKPSPLDLLP